jgi:hypothetical protein
VGHVGVLIVGNQRVAANGNNCDRRLMIRGHKKAPLLIGESTAKSRFIAERTMSFTIINISFSGC